jgi:uncharacterized protein (TIGR04255 family)
MLKHPMKPVLPAIDLRWGMIAAKRSTPTLPKTPRPAGLPDFDDPPVAEVLLDAALDPLPLVRNAHLGLFWAEHLRDEFPVIADQPPLPLNEERFEKNPAEQSPVQIRLEQGVPVFRQWFISGDDTRLIQLQQDRFIQNWRRRSPDASDYPRYESLRESFERHFMTYSEFLVSNDLGTPTIRQTEMTYTNHFQPDEVWQDQRDLDRVLRCWRPDFGNEALLTDPIEDVSLAWRHTISDETGPFARLHVSLFPVVAGGLVLQLTVRGKPRDGSLKTTMAFFDMGRERIVKGFTAITTDAMHQRWRRKA